MSDEPQIRFHPIPKRGRPRVEEPKERVSTRLPQQTYERLRKVASRRDQSMSEIACQIIQRALGQ